MSNGNIRVALLGLGMLAIAVPTACQSASSTARFEVVSVNVKPATVAAGEKATVTAGIRNVGGAEGVYAASLLVDGSAVATKDVDVLPGQTQEVVFSLSESRAGTHEIEVGRVRANFAVTPKLIAKQIELGYDQDKTKDFVALIKPFTGYLVGFEAPSDPFTINKIRIHRAKLWRAQLPDQGPRATDMGQRQKPIYTASLSGDRFPLITYVASEVATQGAWAELDVPEVKVGSNFYVQLYAGLDVGQGFRMGADNSVENAHSDITARDSSGADVLSQKWPYTIERWFGDKSRVNWMVRVVGTAMVPQ